MLLPLLLGPVTAPAPTTDTSAFLANVADASNGAPVVDAEVAIPDLSRIVRTNWIGEAQIAAVPRGEHRVQVRHIGYASADLTIRFDHDTVGYVFMLTPVPASLDTVKTSAKSSVPLKLQDFEWRRRMGFGRFLTDSVLLAEKTHPIASIMALHFPGLYSVGHDRTVTRFNCGGVDVYVDGVRSAGRGGDLTDLRSIEGQDVAGVEYYRSTEAPVQFQSNRMSRCGVLLIWLRP